MSIFGGFPMLYEGVLVHHPSLPTFKFMGAVTLGVSHFVLR
jgi:hypothetical protein